MKSVVVLGQPYFSPAGAAAKGDFIQARSVREALTLLDAGRAQVDLAVAAEDARFATSGINVGLFCSTPAVPLSRNMHRKQAMQMLLTGKLMDAETAMRFGLINEAVPPEALDETVTELATVIAAKSPFAVALGKRSFYRQYEMDRAQAYDYVADQMVRAFQAEDAREGIAAFLEKRPPVWKGR